MHGPAVVVFEDLHWADETDGGLSRGDSARCRRRATPAHRHGEAGALREARGRRLAGRQPSPRPGGPGGAGDRAPRRLDAGGATAPAEITQAVAERCGGNPLFAEELVRLLDERGAPDAGRRAPLAAPGAELPVSGSIQALIAARLDAPPSDAKAALADAAVVGRVFWAAPSGHSASATRRRYATLLADLAERQLVRAVAAIVDARRGRVRVLARADARRRLRAAHARRAGAQARGRGAVDRDPRGRSPGGPRGDPRAPLQHRARPGARRGRGGSSRPLCPRTSCASRRSPASARWRSTWPPPSGSTGGRSSWPATAASSASGCSRAWGARSS